MTNIDNIIYFWNNDDIVIINTTNNIIYISKYTYPLSDKNNVDVINKKSRIIYNTINNIVYLSYYINNDNIRNIIIKSDNSFIINDETIKPICYSNDRYYNNTNTLHKRFIKK